MIRFFSRRRKNQDLHASRTQDQDERNQESEEPSENPCQKPAISQTRQEEMQNNEADNCQGTDKIDAASHSEIVSRTSSVFGRINQEIDGNEAKNRTRIFGRKSSMEVNPETCTEREHTIVAEDMERWRSPADQLRETDASKQTGKSNDPTTVKTDLNRSSRDTHVRALPSELNDKNNQALGLYIGPPIIDLQAPVSRHETSVEDENISKDLVACLADHGISADVAHITYGPDEIRYELELAPGTRISSIEKLHREIATMMKTSSIRLEAPILGKSLVGISKPKPLDKIPLRAVMGTEAMKKDKSVLSVALGMDKTGNPIICDLSNVLHLLIGGQTGSGKSMLISSIIVNLLFRAHPDEIKMILINMNESEMNIFNGIPHLMTPVINDRDKACAALAYACILTKRRDELFSIKGAYNIESYNTKLVAGEKPMPRVVVIIDGLEKITCSDNNSIIDYLEKLITNSSRYGIHVIVSTQRLLKESIPVRLNLLFPSKIAFKTGSIYESKMILGQSGAEKLRGTGDMLCSLRGICELTWVQGCFVTHEELVRITDHVREVNPCIYDNVMLEELQSIDMAIKKGVFDIENAYNVVSLSPSISELFYLAVDYALTDGQISASTIQRRMKIGYARAVKLIDEMEERGIISAKDGSLSRKCMITRKQWEEITKLMT